MMASKVLFTIVGQGKFSAQIWPMSGLILSAAL